MLSHHVTTGQADALIPEPKHDADEALARVCGFACYPSRDAVRAASSVTGLQVIRVPTIPFPGGTSQADFWRSAADHIEGGYSVGGSNLTAAVVKLLRSTAEAIQ